MKRGVLQFLLLVFQFVFWYIPLNRRNEMKDINLILDVQQLRVAQLKAILKSRGVYGNYLEKHELVEQVKLTGIVVQEDVEQINSTGTPMHFQCEREFTSHTQAENEQKTAWLIRVWNPRNRVTVREDTIWEKVQEKVALTGIRVATLQCCWKDSNLCHRWPRVNTGLALMVPDGYGKFTEFHTPFPSSEATLYEWLSTQLGPFAETGDAETLITNKWLQVPECQVLFITNSSTRPPLFFSLLSARFAGWIRFSYLPNVTTSSIGSLRVRHFPSYVILTHGHQLTFGSRPGERLSYSSMETFLLGIPADLRITCDFVITGLASLHWITTRTDLTRSIRDWPTILFMSFLLVEVGSLVFEWIYLFAMPDSWCRLLSAITVRLISPFFALLADSDSFYMYRLVIGYWQAHFNNVFPVFFKIFLLVILMYALVRAVPNDNIRLEHQRHPEQLPDTRRANWHARTAMLFINRQELVYPPEHISVRSSAERQQGNERVQGTEQLRPMSPLLGPIQSTERLTELLRALNAPNQTEWRQANPQEFEYCKCLKVWTWGEHAHDCPRRVNAEEGTCCQEKAKDSACAAITFEGGSLKNQALGLVSVTLADGKLPPGVDLAKMCTHCVFCQFEFSKMDTLGTLPCRHSFHLKGIQRWLLDRQTLLRCPTCRQPCKE